MGKPMYAVVVVVQDTVKNKIFSNVYAEPTRTAGLRTLRQFKREWEQYPHPTKVVIYSGVRKIIQD